MNERSWRLTRRAEAALGKVFAWTYQRFGPAQADRYKEMLIERCSAIASGRAHARRCCDVPADDIDPRLNMVRAGRHIVIFAEINNVIVIQDFLHEARDLPAHLARRLSVR